MGINSDYGPKPWDDPNYEANQAQQAQQQKMQLAQAQLDKINGQISQQQAAQAANASKGPGYEALTQSDQEKAAGILPPGYNGMTDTKTGQLLDQYKINPFAGEASQRLRQEALSTGPSAWANNALKKQGFEESGARSAAALQQQQGQSNAMSQLMRQGGLGGGARTSLARSGARDALMASQGVGSQGILQRYGINDTDTKRRQELLGQNADVERQADLQNINTASGELKNRATFDANRYNQQMGAWAAKQSADATRAAGRSGGGKK
jgi:hypothetical protein